MDQCFTSVFIVTLLTILAGEVRIGETGVAKKSGSKDDFVRIVIPEYVREGDTVFLKCLHNVETDNLYSMKWYKGSQEFFRFTPKESPPVKSFSTFGGQVDLRQSNFSDVALVKVHPNMTDRYTCEVTKDFPDYTTSMKTGKMTVVALPDVKPEINVMTRSLSVGDSVVANCSYSFIKPAVDINWLLNGVAVDSHHIFHHTTPLHQNNKETITSGIKFTARHRDFIRGRMTLTCQAKIQPDIYTTSVDVVIREHPNPNKLSVASTFSFLPSAENGKPSYPALSSSANSEFLPSHMSIVLSVISVELCFLVFSSQLAEGYIKKLI